MERARSHQTPPAGSCTHRGTALPFRRCVAVTRSNLSPSLSDGKFENAPLQPRLPGYLRNVKLLVYQPPACNRSQMVFPFHIGFVEKELRYLSFRHQVPFRWDVPQHPTASLIPCFITTEGPQGKGERRGTRGSAALPPQRVGIQHHPSTPKQACKLEIRSVWTAQSDPAPPEVQAGTSHHHLPREGRSSLEAGMLTQRWEGKATVSVTQVRS